MSVQEDVFGYLVDENIINIISYDGKITESLSAELSNEWSKTMKDLLQGYIHNQKMYSGKAISESPGTHAITQSALAKMGRKFNADYIVRGRILEYKTRQEASWAPWKKGLLPFTISGTNRIINGFVK